MKTKFYELVLPKIKLPTITRTYLDCIFKDIKCEAADEWAINNFSKYRATSDINDLFFNKGIFDYSKNNRYNSSGAVIDMFDNVDDTPLGLKNYLSKLTNIAEVVICHRQHPNKENIRQIALIEGKTDRSIHWID